MDRKRGLWGRKLFRCEMKMGMENEDILDVIVFYAHGAI